MESLDLSGVPCPQNTTKILLKLAMMEPGEVLEAILQEGEAHGNVLHSLEDEAVRIIADEAHSEKRRLIRIEKLEFGGSK